MKALLLTLFLFFTTLYADNFTLGLQHYNLKIYSKAFEEFNQCTTDKYCQAMIGLMYQKAQGTKKDIQKAKIWYEKAANQGDLSSMHNLGVLYLNEKKYNKAEKWLLKAAQDGKGYTPSIYNLGLIYLYGWGVKPDYQKALNYMQQAKSLGYEQANAPITWLNEQLKN